MNLLGSLAIAFSMYSRIPMPQVSWTKERMKYAVNRCGDRSLDLRFRAGAYGA